MNRSGAVWHTVPLPDPVFPQRGSDSETESDASSSESAVNLNSYEPPDVLQHGRECSSHEEGDGPSLDKALFLEAWPYVATWIKQKKTSW